MFECNLFAFNPWRDASGNALHGLKAAEIQTATRSLFDQHV